MKSQIQANKADTVPSSETEISSATDHVLEFRKRMLEWPNPVEYVNNMYGCHPGDDEDDNEYFRAVFRK